MLALLIFLKETLAWNSMNLHDLMVEKQQLKFWVVKNFDLQKTAHETTQSLYVLVYLSSALTKQSIIRTCHLKAP